MRHVCAFTEKNNNARVLNHRAVFYRIYMRQLFLKILWAIIIAAIYIRNNINVN